MQILFEPSNKPSYEYPNQYFHFRIPWKKQLTLLKTVPVTELRLPISSIPENGIVHYFQIR